MFDRAIWRQQVRATLFFWGGLPLLVLSPGLLLDRLLGIRPWPASSPVLVLAAILLFCGIAFIWQSTLDLARRGLGTPSPLRPAKQLVTEGSYRFCRHPMYFGYDLLLLAAALLLRSPTTLMLGYPLFLSWSITQLRREERVLLARFRDQYARYQAEVPFLVPRWGSREKKSRPPA